MTRRHLAPHAFAQPTVRYEPAEKDLKFSAQGNGEVAGTGIEVPLRVRLQVDVIKRKKISWPRFENDTMLMTVGALVTSPAPGSL